MIKKLFGLILIIFSLIFIILSCSQPVAGGSGSNSNDPAPPPNGLSSNEHELIKSTDKSGNAANGDEIWYYFDAGVDCSYKITYSGDVILSAYHEDKETVFAGDVSDIKSIKNERIYVKIVGTVDSNESDAFSLKYELNNATLPKTWTIMIYQNCADLEVPAFANIKEMISAYHENIGINVILLLDKKSTSGYGIAGCSFDDTRLFAVKSGGLTRINGGAEFPEITSISTYEANMGDPVTLKKFIEFSKNNFPAEHYALIINSHGQGTGGFSSDDKTEDRLHQAEISETLNNSHSIDVLGFNACLMGNIETAYQFRNDSSNSGFKAQYLLASPTPEQDVNWCYDNIFARIDKLKGGNENGEDETITDNGIKEKLYDPSVMTPEEFSLIVIEEYRDFMYQYSPGVYYLTDSICLYDLSKVKSLKEKIDELALSLYANGEREAFENTREDGQMIRYFRRINNNTEFNELEKAKYPFYDIKALTYLINLNEDSDFCSTTISKANEISGLINNFIIYSYFGNYISTTDMYGISIFISSSTDNYLGENVFKSQWWYNANDVSGKYSKEKYEGKLQFCKDGATSGNNTVENWFELMDAWFDGGGNDADGGWNGYRY